MQKPSLVLLVSALAVSASAQLAITSLQRTGELTWTNSISNAVYAVEWASSPTGPWHSFETPTNLNFIEATNGRVSASVPVAAQTTFYRVAWTDAPPGVGLYEVREYDQDNVLVVTGQLQVASKPGSASFQGTRHLAATDPLAGPWVYGPQIGRGTVRGWYSSTTEPLQMTVDLNPEFNDNNVLLRGSLVGNVYLGTWAWFGFSTAPLAEGTFTATKLHSETPPPADPSGTWDYWTGSVTGQLAFANSVHPLAGDWLFENQYPAWPTTHLLGHGSFTNAVLSTNDLRITIPTDTGLFVLDGVMAGDSYAGFVQWTGTTTNSPIKDMFLARRRTSHKNSALVIECK